MNETAPCKGCTERHTACHGSCEKYKEWQERYRAQQQHLADNRNRWAIPLTSAREKAYANYHPSNRKYVKGGSYE